MADNQEPLMVRVRYIPRGKHGAHLCTPLNFIGKCIGKSIDDGYYKIQDTGGFTYRVPLQDIWEIE